MRREQKKYTRHIAGKIVLAVLLWAVAISRIIVAGKPQAKETIVSAFNQVALQDMSATVETFGYYGNVYLSMEARKNLVRNIGYQLGMSNCEITGRIEDGVYITEICRDGTNAKTTIRMITKEESVTDTVVDSHQYVDIDIDLYGNLESALHYKEVLEKVLEEYGITADVTVNLSGSLKGKVDMALRNMVADHFIELLDGKIVAQNRTEELYTIYAYTKKVQDSIILGGKRVNLNISAFYDEEQDITCFYMATPIINASY